MDKKVSGQVYHTQLARCAYVTNFILNLTNHFHNSSKIKHHSQNLSSTGTNIFCKDYAVNHAKFQNLLIYSSKATI